MVDYKKWDNFVMSDDEEEEKQAPRGGPVPRGGPRVTRLEKGQTITIGADGGWSASGKPAGGGGGSGGGSGGVGGGGGCGGGAPSPKLTIAAAPAVPAAKKKASTSLDYSKWDNLDTDSEEEAETYQRDDVNEFLDKEDEYWEERLAEKNAAEKEAQVKEAAAAKAKKESEAAKPKAAAALKAPDDAKSALAAITHNGSTGFGSAADTPAFVWSQTSDQLTARVLLPAATTAKQVRVRLWTLPSESQQAIQKCRLAVGCQHDASTPGFDTLVQGQLHGAVWTQGDEKPLFTFDDRTADEWEDQTETDWAVEDLPPGMACNQPACQWRCVRIAMKKRPPIQGLVHWWPRLLVPGDSIREKEVDLAALKDRKQQGNVADAWAVAQASFQEKLGVTKQPKAI